MSVGLPVGGRLLPVLFLISHVRSTVKDSSVVAVEIFDQRKIKRRDRAFLGVVNVRVSDVLDFDLGGHGEHKLVRHCPACSIDTGPSRNASSGSEKVQR